MSIKDDLYFLLNKYKIEKDKYVNCISNVYFYNRDNIVQNEHIENLENFICPICLAILKRPKFCSSKENSHSFCKECIEKYLEKNNKCPICKNIFENKTKSVIEKQLYTFNFKCIFHKEGCPKIINYLDYFNHINECKYSNILYKCQVEKYNYLNKEFEKCNYIGNIKEIENHFKLCAFIKYKCIFCKEIILQISLMEHVENKCKIGIIKYLDGEIYIGEKKIE